MKKFLITLLLLCSLFVTGCSGNLFEGSKDNALVFQAISVEDYSNTYISGQYVINKDGTCEYSVSDGWQGVGALNAIYSDFDAQIRKTILCCGTYIQGENTLLLTLDEKKHYCILEVQGNDADAFKAVYSLNNPDKGNTFDNRVETDEGFTASSFSTTTITAEICEDKLKILCVTNYYNGDSVEQTEFTYADDQKIKSIKFRNATHDIVYDYSFNNNGDCTLTSSYYCDLDSAGIPYKTIINNADGSARFTLYNNNGKIYCAIDSENGTTNIGSFKGTMCLYSYNDDGSYIVTVYKNSLLPKAKYITQTESYAADGTLTETIPYKNSNPSK